jgi:hypothetical protein
MGKGDLALGWSVLTDDVSAYPTRTPINQLSPLSHFSLLTYPITSSPTQPTSTSSNMSAQPDTSLPKVSGSKTVFLTGATGYIGGTVLTKLLSLSTPPATITLLIRDEKKAQAIAQLKTNGTTLKPIIGSLQDLETLTKAAAEADIVINTADADDLPAAKALIEGMKQRKEKTKHRSLFIHTSGTGVLTDNAKGQYPSDTVSWFAVCDHRRDCSQGEGRADDRSIPT